MKYEIWNEMKFVRNSFFSVSSKQTNYYGSCLIEEGETTTTTTKTREKKA